MSKSSKIASGAGALMVAVLGAGFVQGLVPGGIIPANVSNIEKAYHLTHTEFGRMLGWSQAGGGIAGGLFGGWLCGAIGGIPSLLIAIAMGTISLCTVGRVPTLFATFAGLTGFFLSKSTMNAANALATKMLPDRQRGVTLLHGTNAMGKLVGAGLGSIFVYTLWRYSFLVAGLLTLAVAIPTLMARGHIHASTGLKQPGGKRAGLYFWLAASGFGFISGSELAASYWIKIYGTNVLRFPEGKAKMLLIFLLLGIVAGRFGASWLSQRISSKGAILICGLCSFFVVPALYFKGFIPVAGSLFLFGLTFSAAWPSYFAHLSQVFPENLGMLAGASALATWVGVAACSWISGWLADINLRYGILFGAAVALTFLVLFFVSPLGREPRKAEQAA